MINLNINKYFSVLFPALYVFFNVHPSVASEVDLILRNDLRPWVISAQIGASGVSSNSTIAAQLADIIAQMSPNATTLQGAIGSLGRASSLSALIGVTNPASIAAALGNTSAGNSSIAFLF